ncbi:MAG: hypothetical protein AAB473_02030 [Patescibacteria group bacterium]
MNTRFRWALRVVALGAVLITMTWLTVGTQGVFASPDESANAFFARTFAETGSMVASEPLNAVAQGVIHPRSMIAPGTAILPTSFLGFPFVSGGLRYIFGEFIQYFFTPIIAALAIAALWWTVRKLSNNELLADCSAFFALIHPAFWYYGARVMMPNVAFVSMLMVGVAAFVLACSKRSSIIGFIAGLIFATGLTMRLVEAPMMMAVVAVVLVAYRKSLPWKVLCGVAIGGAIVLGAYLVGNSALYGSALTTGYTLPDARSTTDAVVAISPIASIGHLLLPFGFHPRAMVTNVFHYGWWLYPVSSTLAVIGAWFAWTAKEHRKAWRTFVVCLGVAAVWMAVVYGSWSVADNPDPKAITIGNSHVRYWLPLFFASSVLVALGVLRIRKKMTHGLKSTVGSIMLVVIIATLSAQTVFLGSDGLIAARAAAIASIEKRAGVLADTEYNAVVIVDRADKYLFPYRRVIVPLRSDSTYAAMPMLAPIVPLYYFGITFPQSDLEYLNSEKLGAMGLSISPVVTIQDETLYRIQLK